MQEWIWVRWISFLLPMFAVACAPCYSFKYKESSLANRENQDFEFYACSKNDNSVKQKINLTANQDFKLIRWGEGEKIYNRTDLGSTCHDQNDSSEQTEMLLMPTALATVKLCQSVDVHHPNHYFIVKNSQGCPTDTTEVTTTCTL